VIPANLESIAKQALKGERKALKDLLEQGEVLHSMENYDAAAVVFKESAVCYRIALYRERCSREELEDRVALLERKLNFTQALLEQHWQPPNFVVPLGAELSFANIAKIYMHELEWTEELSISQVCITQLWQEQGVRFSSPGNSVERKTIGYIKNVLELTRKSEDYNPHYYGKKEIMILEPLINAVLKRL
jgi:hypothetical protein